MNFLTLKHALRDTFSSLVERSDFRGYIKVVVDKIAVKNTGNYMVQVARSKGEIMKKS